MKIEHLADEALMRLNEHTDRCNALDRAIAIGRSKMPASELASRRARLPVDAAIARALRLIARRRSELTADLLAAIESDAP